ncbi:hypothetical protein D5086_030378 [Populus alba]|uniref:3'-5' exonuclease n=2 Tax=Populus alba TaxID=43335 RepID=A0A4U5QPZ3_POPAL|nr:Werner Syndrome-like exonuclease [Populus alba]TKS12944.1 Werner Syndrome-like exonuclease [Populus alba]
MNSRQHETNNNSKINWSPILDWDQPLTDQELEAIDAIEASFQSSTPSSSSSSTSSTPAATTPSSSVIKKRHSSPQKDQEPPKTRRQLPNSIFSLSKPFSLSPCQGNVKMRYPAMKFGGQILYSRTSIEVEKAARELLQSLEAEKREMDRVIIGFDIEWKPSFTTGVLPGKAAVMQICANTSLCHVMHIFHSGITQSLQFLLEDSKIVKVGIGIGGDCAKVFRDYNVSVKSVEDLSYLANQKLDGKPKTWGLQALAKILVCKELQKPNKIRLGNWQVDVLSKEQLQYAATDAFASWQLYQVLKSLPDAKDATDPTSKELKVEST